METQFVRGGGTVCIWSLSLWHRHSSVSHKHFKVSQKFVINMICRQTCMIAHSILIFKHYNQLFTVVQCNSWLTYYSWRMLVGKIFPTSVILTSSKCLCNLMCSNFGLFIHIVVSFSKEILNLTRMCFKSTNN
ncbi:hypothetical protein Anas_07527, partial [Armadillidium nasatum]